MGRWLLVPVVVVTLLAPTTGPAAAQGEPVTWGIQPASTSGPGTRPSFLYDVGPGDTVSDVVRVDNFSEAEVTLDLYATDAFNTDAGGFDVLAGAETPTDVGAWTRLDQRTVTIPARSHIEVPFTLEVPADAEPGDHAGGIVASRRSAATDEAGNPIRVDHRVGTRIYLRVDGPLHPALVVDRLATSFDGTVNPAGTGSVSVAYTVRNAGNVRLSASQAVEVSSLFGLVDRQVALDDLPELLPGSTFTGTAVVDGVLPGLRLTTDLVLGPRSPSGAEDEVRAAADGWAVPWATLVLVLVVGATAAVVVRRRRRSAVPGADVVGYP